MKVPLENPAPDFGRLLKSFTLDGAPDRLPAMELFCDEPIMRAVLGMDREQEFTRDDYFRFQTVMGYDYVNVQAMPHEKVFVRHQVDEENPDSLAETRNFQDEHTGPIQTWDEFEAFNWPTVETTGFHQFDHAAANLPEGMKIIAWLGGFFENVTWSMGIQTFCYKLIDERDLVRALFEKWGQYAIDVSRVMIEQPEVGAYWLSDDLGFNSGPFMSPKDCREFVMPVFEELGSLCRAKGIPFVLHSCGKLHSIMDDLIACGVNCLHSLPPGLYDLAEIKQRWGDKLCFAGNIDLNTLSMGSEEDTREAVRQVKKVWAQDPRGGIVLSSANSVANYCKVENYLAMMDECHKV